MAATSGRGRRGGNPAAFFCTPSSLSDLALRQAAKSKTARGFGIKLNLMIPFSPMLETGGGQIHVSIAFYCRFLAGGFALGVCRPKVRQTPRRLFQHRREPAHDLARVGFNLTCSARENHERQDITPESAPIISPGRLAFRRHIRASVAARRQV